MEAPNKIWYEKGSYPCATDVESDKTHHDTKYIRADLVQRLKGYAVHGPLCRATDPVGWDGLRPACTCGLTELLGEIEG